MNRPRTAPTTNQDRARVGALAEVIAQQAFEIVRGIDWHTGRTLTANDRKASAAILADYARELADVAYGLSR